MKAEANKQNKKEARINRGRGIDLSNGYENIASEYISVRDRTPTGTKHVTEWAKALNVRSKVLDIGCGNGIPVTKAVLDEGHTLFAIDASKSMIQAFQQQFPNVTAKCEALENSDFFEETYDGVIAIGVIFLLEESTQLAMIQRVGDILRIDGQFLFSAPIESGKWNDNMTDLESISLGKHAYEQALAAAGMRLLKHYSDEGSNNHYSAIKKPR